MRSSLSFALIAASLTSLPVVPAYALRANTYVASYGTDSGNCSFSAPCRTFAFALSAVLPGGVVTAIDSAGNSPFTIDKAVTIAAPAGVTPSIQVSSGGDAITINAGSNDVVEIRGLTLNGGGVGYNGIVFNSGGSLIVADCVVKNFAYSGSGDVTGNGIFIQPTGNITFTITNTSVSNVGLVGVLYQPVSGSPNAIGVIDHVTTTNNPYGMDFYTAGTTGSTVIAVTNSVASNNTTSGIFTNNGAAGPVTLSIDNVTASGNASGGIEAFGTVQVLLGRSVITGNLTEGINNGTSPTNTFYTYGDNRINLNGTDISGSALKTTFPVQ